MSGKEKSEGQVLPPAGETDLLELVDLIRAYWGKKTVIKLVVGHFPGYGSDEEALGDDQLDIEIFSQDRKVVSYRYTYEDFRTGKPIQDLVFGAEA